MRKSYKGGWSYLNPKYANLTVGEGCVYDVNSMYPWAMKYCELPYGEPTYFKGPPKPDNVFKLFVIQLKCTFKLKTNRFPSIQLKHTMHYADNEYIEESVAPVLLTLTSVDYELFLYNYDVDIIEYYGGYAFRGKVGLFTEYIDFWYTVKEESKRESNKGMEFIAKRMLNSLYGKFGARIEGKSKIPFYNEEKDLISYKLSPLEERTGVYVPVASFITSYCRDKIIRAAESCYDRFVYADTDSIHILGHEPVDIDIDEYRLGAFKLETKFNRARFIRQKTYMEITVTPQIDYDGFIYDKEELNVKCAGMPAAMQRTVEEKDFFHGAQFDIGPDSRFAPKLSPKTVPGGVILREMPFKIH